MTKPFKKAFQTSRIGLTLILFGGLVVVTALLFYFWPSIISAFDNHEVTSSSTGYQLGVSAEFSVEEAPLPTVTSLYPGRFSSPKDWLSPEYLGEDRYGFAPSLPEGFVQLGSDKSELKNLVGVDDQNASHATSISIPHLGIESSVDELHRPDTNNNGVIDNGDGPYPNPNNFVGYVDNPSEDITSLPGQSSSGWYFGHLESLGEGNVFNTLPKVANIVRDEPVDVIVNTDEASFLYRVKQTLNISRDDIETDLFAPSLSENEHNIYLVTCWPARNYTQRFVAVAELVAVKSLDTQT